MHGYWSFEVTVRPLMRRVLVVFCSAPSPTEEEVAERVERYCDTRRSPNQIYLLAPRSEEASLRAVCESSKFEGRIQGVTQYLNPPAVRGLLFDGNGAMAALDGAAVPEGEMGQIKRQGLALLIRHRNVSRTAPLSHHFVVPSGQHAQSFVRIGDAMTDGAEIDFIAFCCLPYISPGVRHIYCDSGTISPIAYAIGVLRKRIDPKATFPCISSFESYSNMKMFEFRDMDNAVALISLTTTGTLAKRLSAEHPDVRPEKILTLFTLCDQNESLKSVCDLRRDANSNPHGLDPIPTYPEADCPLCKRGSSLIRISSDQFLSGKVEVRAMMLRVTHQPRWLGGVLKRMVGTGVIRANYKSEATKHATSEVFFDLEKLFRSDDMLGIADLQSRLQWIIDLAVPAMLTRIISLDGLASEAMASAIKKKIEAKLPLVELIEYKTIAAEDESKHVRDSGATLVVAAAAASGRSLLAVSQKLRRIQKNGAICYMIGMARFFGPEAAKEVENNLTRGEQQRKFSFNVLEHAYLPLASSGTPNCWDVERELLNAIDNECSDAPTKGLLDRRIKEILAAKSAADKGMDNTLFWRTPAEKTLALRPGFAFFDFPVPVGTSQADVFFTIVSILHSLRSNRDDIESLYQYEFFHRVLAPRCFDRYNDGVIQSCLLRAALPIELDYSADEESSVQMEQILDVILSKPSEDTGEAAREFLLALATQRLRLRTAELERLKERYKDGGGDPIAKLFWERIGPPPSGGTDGASDGCPSGGV